MKIFLEKPDFNFRPGPCHCAKLKKKFLETIQSYEDASFSNPKWPLPQ